MSDISLLRKIENYNKSHCYQYEVKLQTLEEDKQRLGLTDEDIANIKISDFEYRFIDTEEEKKKCREFIKKYEWIGEITQFSTHYFGAYYKDELGCVIIFSQPNAFSKLLGDNTKYIERLLSRGASTSWCPKCLASNFISWAIKWMVNNTDYRLFTAYSDEQALERGVIYASLNWFYLGKKSGTAVRCINPYNPQKIVSDRTFRSRSFFKRYAKSLGIEWQKNWNNDQSILWDNIPDDIEKRLREYSKEMYKNAEKISFPPKRKWAFLLGRDKKETRLLRREFLRRNKVYPYPDDIGNKNKE